MYVYRRKRRGKPKIKKGKEKKGIDDEKKRKYVR